MVSSFRLEDKLDNATRFQRWYLVSDWKTSWTMLQGFKGMHLYMLYKLYHLAKHECVCRESIRDLIQAVILDSMHLEEKTHPP
jgi:hypothetical protein